MSRIALLDVNVLVALFDPDHVHHDLAHDWFADQKADGWATCPVTENGLVRVLSHPHYGSPVSRPDAIVVRLRTFRTSGGHHFWPARVSLTDDALFKPAFIRGSRQLTDVYLLGVAVAAGGRFATFDRTIPVQAVNGASRSTVLVITGESAADDVTG